MCLGGNALFKFQSRVVFLLFLKKGCLFIFCHFFNFSALFFFWWKGRVVYFMLSNKYISKLFQQVSNEAWDHQKRKEKRFSKNYQHSLFWKIFVWFLDSNHTNGHTCENYYIELFYTTTDIVMMICFCISHI